MANIFAIHSVGNSLATFLRDSYPSDLRTDFACTFRLVSSGELDTIDDTDTTLSLFLHRITFNQYVRNSQRLNHAQQLITPLALDLHYLLTIWTNSALTEQTILAWAMRQIHLNSLLNAAVLSPDAGWDAHDVLQIAPAELTNEELMRVWDKLKPSYRLSIPYVIRVVRIDPEVTLDSLPVVTTDLIVEDR